MTLQQIEFFLSCTSLLNFSRTAKHHYASISTVSRQIASLEEELGVTLFERNSHAVSLTYAGEFFFESAMNIKEIIDRYQKDLDAFDLRELSKNGAFQIACYPFDSMFWRLLNLIDYFPSDGLSKPCKISIVRPGKIVETVLRGDAQLGVALASTLKEYRDVVDSRMFCRVPLCLRVGHAHPLNGQKSVRAADLLKFFVDLSIHHDLDNGIESRHLNPTGDGIDVKKIQNLAGVIEDYLLSRSPGITDSCALLDRPDCMLVMSEYLEVPKFKRLHPVSIKDYRVMADFAVFWKKGDADPDIERFLSILELQNGFVAEIQKRA